VAEVPALMAIETLTRSVAVHDLDLSMLHDIIKALLAHLSYSLS